MEVLKSFPKERRRPHWDLSSNLPFGSIFVLSPMYWRHLSTYQFASLLGVLSINTCISLEHPSTPMNFLLLVICPVVLT